MHDAGDDLRSSKLESVGTALGVDDLGESHGAPSNLAQTYRKR